VGYLFEGFCHTYIWLRLDRLWWLFLVAEDALHGGGRDAMTARDLPLALALAVIAIDGFAIHDQWFSSDVRAFEPGAPQTHPNCSHGQLEEKLCGMAQSSFILQEFSEVKKNSSSLGVGAEAMFRIASMFPCSRRCTSYPWHGAFPTDQNQQLA
jgi:hypothetical protein